ncbi:MAG: alpha/beta hydrolase, partial [Myxococcaceae bacterium]|nr:alpha/beta hydrolase [Myxococcaceae bacterium]
FELSLAHYFSWCKDKPTRCTWADGNDPATAFAQLRAAVETAPIPSATADRPLGPGEFTTGVGTPLYGTENAWSVLSDALLAAVQGDGSGLVKLTDFYLNRNDDGSYPNEQEAYDAVMCTDRTTPSVADVRAQAPAFAAAAPNCGVSGLAEWLVCSDWASHGKDLPAPVGQGAGPILVVGSTNDPATPYAWAEALAHELASGVLLTRHGEGHTAYQMGDACIDSAIESYLIAPSTQTASCPGAAPAQTAVSGALPRVAPGPRTAWRLR